MSAEFVWDNRVIRHVDPWGDVTYLFAEVTYDENDKPDAYTTVCMVSEDLDGMLRILERLQTALTQPILEAKDFPQNNQEAA
jgi:hypothetical protein